MNRIFFRCSPPRRWATPIKKPAVRLLLCFLNIVIIIGIGSTAYPMVSGADITGKVVYPDKVGVSNAELTFTNQTDTTKVYVVETDENGNFELNDLWTDVNDISRGDWPKTFALYQNVPNPAEGETTIYVETPKAGYVKLSVYNMLGQEIKEADGYDLKNANPGVHGVRYMPNGVTGTYLVVVEGFGKRLVHKMTAFGGNPHGSGFRGEVSAGSLRKEQKVAEVALDDAVEKNYRRSKASAMNSDNLYQVGIRSKDGHFKDKVLQDIAINNGMYIELYVKEMVNHPDQIDFNFDEAGSQEIYAVITSPTGIDAGAYSIQGNSNLLVRHSVSGDTIKVLLQGADGDVNGTYEMALAGKAEHGTQIHVPINGQINAMPDVDLLYKYIEAADNPLIADAVSRLIASGNAYETSDGQLRVQLTPGNHIVSANSDSSLTPYIIQLEDGRELVNYVGKDHGPLVLGTDDVNGIVYLINKHFDDHDIYNKTFDKVFDDPPGFDGWAPPADGSDPAGTITQQTMGIDSVASDPYTVNVYSYLGEDADHQLEAPFDVIRNAFYLHDDMPDSVQAKIAEYVQGELNEYHNLGREESEKYKVNVYVGRDPPLRYVMENGRPNVWPKVGWHVFTPSKAMRDNAEAGLDNKIYSALTKVDVYHGFSEKAMKCDGAQPVVGARSDIVTPDGTELITFFNEYTPDNTFQKWDKQAMKISNMFGPGFKFK